MTIGELLVSVSDQMQQGRVEAPGRLKGLENAVAD
jgi:hypothetical protein